MRSGQSRAHKSTETHILVIRVPKGSSTEGEEDGQNSCHWCCSAVLLKLPVLSSCRRPRCARSIIATVHPPCTGVTASCASITSVHKRRCSQPSPCASAGLSISASAHPGDSAAGWDGNLELRGNQAGRLRALGTGVMFARAMCCVLGTLWLPTKHGSGGLVWLCMKWLCSQRSCLPPPCRGISWTWCLTLRQSVGGEHTCT